MRGQSLVSPVWHAAIAAWSWYGPGDSGAERPTSAPSAICAASQSERSWSSSRTTVPSTARLAPRVLEQHQREQAEHLRLVGHQRGEHPPESDRLAGEVGACSRVAVVEDQVDGCEHGGRGVREARRRAGRGTGSPRRGSSASPARAAAPSSARAVRNARAISGVVRPPSIRSVSATCASVASAGWQHVKISASRSSGIVLTSSSSSAGSSRGQPLERRAASTRGAAGRSRGSGRS